jgi:hypothetical protein
MRPCPFSSVRGGDVHRQRCGAKLVQFRFKELLNILAEVWLIVLDQP